MFKVIPFHNAVDHVGIVAMDHADDQGTGAGKLVQLDGGAVQVQRHAAGNIDRGLVGNAVDPFRQYNFPHTGSLGIRKKFVQTGTGLDGICFHFIRIIVFAIDHFAGLAGPGVGDPFRRGEIVGTARAIILQQIGGRFVGGGHDHVTVGRDFIRIFRSDFFALFGEGDRQGIDLFYRGGDLIGDHHHRNVLVGDAVFFQIALADSHCLRGRDLLLFFRSAPDLVDQHIAAASAGIDRLKRDLVDPGLTDGKTELMIPRRAVLRRKLDDLPAGHDHLQRNIETVGFIPETDLGLMPVCYIVRHRCHAADGNDRLNIIGGDIRYFQIAGEWGHLLLRGGLIDFVRLCRCRDLSEYERGQQRRQQQGELLQFHFYLR